MSLLGIPIADSLYAIGNVAAPAANATVASLGVIPAGVYKLLFTVENTGTQETTNVLNAKLIVGSTALATFPITSAERRYTVDRITMDGLTSLRVIASVSAIASSSYMATMVATRLAS